MRAEELDYDLPAALIAQTPPSEREAARLLVLERKTGALAHHGIRELPSLVPHALFVFNDTRVIPARLLGTKPSGGRFELLLVERVGGVSPPGSTEPELWRAMGRPLKSLRRGLELEVGGLRIEIGERVGETLINVRLWAREGVEQALETVGRLPLPPYIARDPDSATSTADRERYQTVFARKAGAVAAPTAGLHFGPSLMESLQAAGHKLAFVTLHVGPGTFAPLSVDELAAHPMHEERYELPEATVSAIEQAKRENRPVVAVGTTVVRTLESAVNAEGTLQAGPGATRLCIYPPYEFRVVDALVTNFHLPRSTLLALVMAFAGVDLIRTAYQTAIAAQYRFFSYGDAMLIRG